MDIRWIQPEEILRDVRTGFDEHQYLITRAMITEGCERVGAAIKLPDGIILRESRENGRPIFYQVN